MTQRLLQPLLIAALLCSGAAAAVAQRAPNPAVMAACRGDMERLCAGVQPGGGAIGQCLKSHIREVSPECRQAAAAARQNRPPQ